MHKRGEMMKGKIKVHLKMVISIDGNYETFDEIREDVLTNCIGHGITASDRDMIVNDTRVEKLIWTPKEGE